MSAIPHSPEKANGSIRSVVRALDLLRLINARQGSSLHDLHRLSGLPKPTVFRILLTLQQEGLIEPDGIAGVYHLTPRVLELSSGFAETSLIVKVAAPIALATTRSIKWPLAIGVLDGDAIVVRYSSMRSSPMAVQTSTLGHRLDLLESAMGRAYLTACGAVERGNLLRLVRARSLRPAAEIEAQVQRLTARAELGYGLRSPKKRGDSATLATPIRHQGEVLAILSLTTFGEVMDAGFVADILPILRATAAEIETAYGAARA